MQRGSASSPWRRISRRLVVGTVVFAVLVAGIWRRGVAQAAPVSSAAINARLDSVVAAARAQFQVPGAVVSVVRGDSVVALRGFGFARLEDSTPADPRRSIYRLASVAKLFVATVALQQVEAGRLGLDRPIGEVAPDILVDRRQAGPITLRHLLTHTGGFDERVIGYAAPTREAMRPLGAYLADRLPARGWPPGVVIGYSNHGMALAGYLAERASGVGFAELAARDLFRPVGMTRTFYVEPPVRGLTPDLATGYRCGGGCEPAPAAWSHAYPAGLAFSTAADMARFIRAELNGGRLDSVAVLGDSVVAVAHRRQFGHHPAVPGIGFGFFEQDYRGLRLLTHAGGVPGAATVLVLAPEQRLGFFVATNAGEPGFVKAVAEGLLDVLLVPPHRPAPRASGPVAEYAGSYRLTRYSHFTVERFPAVFAFTVRATARGDTLVLRLGSEVRRYVRTDSLLLHEVSSGAALALRRGTSGRITHLFVGLPSGGAELPAAFERVPWYEGTSFLNEYASAVAGVPVIALGVWGLVAGVRAWWRRHRRAPRAQAPDRRARSAAVAVAVATVALFLVFVFGFVAGSVRDLGRGRGIAFGMDPGAVLLLRLAWPVALMAVLMGWWSVRAWRRQWWDGFDRVCYSVLTFGSLAQVHFLVWWGYLPGRW